MTDTITEYRGKDGRLVAPIPGSEKTRITPDNARDMVRKRVEKYRRAAVARIVDEAKSIDPSISAPADAFGLLAAKQFSTIMDSDKPVMGDVERLHRLMTGDTGNSQRENAAAPGVTFSDPSQLVELLAALERSKAQAVDQARAVDGRETDGNG